MISVLFVAKNSVYKTLGVDCWDEERNALLWPGGNPGVFHPPCRLFCAMRHLSVATDAERYGEKFLALWAIEKVREEGGVLEHPAASKLWDYGLPKPGSSDKYGVCIAVNQWWWDHKARKATWLYICGVKEIPGIPLRIGEPEFTVSHDAGQKKKGLTTPKQRNATPPEFAKWLIQVAENALSEHV